MPDWHGYDRVRPFLSSFLLVIFSQCKPVVSAEPSGDIHPFIQWALTEVCLKEAPTMTWMMMFPPKFLLKLGSQCHQITFRKRRCQRGFIPSQGMQEAAGKGPFLLPHENTAFFLLWGCYSRAPSWKYGTARLDSCACDSLTWGFQPSSIYDYSPALCNLPSLCHYTIEVPHGLRCWSTAFYLVLSWF